MKNVTNVFEKPLLYRSLVLKNKELVTLSRKDFLGKSLICVFFTSYCGVGCPFCFFNSPNPTDKGDINARFNEEGLEKFIQFANQANVGYLQISGGGEPFLERKAILESIKRINADRIILVTSGIWAYNENKAEDYLKLIDEALKLRKTKTRLSIRLSVSSYHGIKLKHYPLVNLLKIFEKKYQNRDDFTLQLKCFDDDSTLFDYLNQYHSPYYIKQIGQNKSDDSNIIKVMPKKFSIQFNNGYSVIVGQSRVFEPSLRPNLYDTQSISRTVSIYNKDLKQSQKYFPSVVYNSIGEKGLDWIVEYNGNVCTWQNRVQDNLLNIYEDDYQRTLTETLSDPLTLSFIEKGSRYRDRIISEISKKTICLMKAVSIRDYAGTLLFEDEKIRLYYTLRVLHDYKKHGRLNDQIFDLLPQELKLAITAPPQELKKLYKQSQHSVFEQEIAKEHDAILFKDFLELVKLGHYELSNDKIKRAITHYNALIYPRKINSLNEIIPAEGMIAERRFTNRVMTIKKLKKFDVGSKKIYIFRHGETEWNVSNRIKGQLENLEPMFTQKGLNDIKQVKQHLIENAIEVIYSSDLGRAKDTAIFANADLKRPISFHKELRGLNMGKYQGLLLRDFLNDPQVQASLKDYTIPFPDGESIQNLNNRLYSFIKTLCENSRYKNIAIVSHSAAMSNLCSYISGAPYQDIQSCILTYSLSGNLKVESMVPVTTKRKEN